ncbi:MAG: TraB/VirB10 family protein [Rickettsia endosymbiont of Argas persicus]
MQKENLAQEELAIKSTPLTSSRREFGYVTRVNSRIKKEVKDYITTGSFARGLLLTGVVVGTGTNNAASPEPIMIRLVDTANFSKGYKTKQIKEAILIGSCSGDISSERAKCRLETVSLINNKGDIIEKNVEGWLIGEDGRPGIKGIVVDKSSDIARMAVLNGVLGGIAHFFQNQATNGIFPISPMTGQQNALKAQDALKAGVYSGTGNALEKLADFAIKRAESMSPVIVVGSGRIVDVVFRKGFDLIDSGEEKQLMAYRDNFTEQVNYHNQNDNNYPSRSNRINSFANNNFSKTNQKLRERFLKDDKNWQEQLDDNSSDLDQISSHEGGF